MTYYETGADDDKDDQEDHYHDDSQSEGDDWKLTEAQQKEIAYLNTLSPEQLRLLAEMDYSQFSDGDRTMTRMVTNPSVVGLSNS